MENLETIIIPSGDGETKGISEDLRRLSAAFGRGEWLKSQGKNVRYQISGIGRDLNKALNKNRMGFGTYFGPIEEGNYNVHPDLWNSIVNYSENGKQGKMKFNPVGIDTYSTNSYENFANCFSRGAEGEFTIVTRRLHNWRFKLMENWARENNYLSDNVKINYVNTPAIFSIKNFIYDVGSLGWSILTGGLRLRKAYRDLKKYNSARTESQTAQADAEIADLSSSYHETDSPHYNWTTPESLSFS